MKTFKQYLIEADTQNVVPKNISGPLGAARTFEQHLHEMEVSKGRRSLSNTGKGTSFPGKYTVSDATQELLRHIGAVGEKHPKDPSFESSGYTYYEPSTGYFHHEYERERNVSGKRFPEIDQHTETF
jgi:hypothetical protein